MAWYIEGRNLHFNVQVDENGLSVSGEGRQFLNPTADIRVDMTQTAELVARWSLYSSRRAAGLASSVSLDVQIMKRYFDAAAVKSATTPVGVIIHRPRLDAANPRHLEFCAFLPHEQFIEIWDIVKAFNFVDRGTYWLRFGFAGFVPHEVAGYSDIISYDEWLGGRPCLSESFAFGLTTTAVR